MFLEEKYVNEKHPQKMSARDCAGYYVLLWLLGASMLPLLLLRALTLLVLQLKKHDTAKYTRDEIKIGDRKVCSSNRNNVA